MNATTETLDRLADQTARYARYARGAGGLGSVIGGVMVLAAFALNGFVDLTPPLRGLLAATPLLWLSAKALLRRHYYQAAGTVVAQPSSTERRTRFWMVLLLALIAVIVVGVVAAAMVRDGRAPEWPLLGYALMVGIMPIAAWRWFWSVSDFLVGVLLFCQSAVVLMGGNYPASWMIYAAACAGIAILYGWREHRDYLALRSEICRRGRAE
ncbi:MAG: hypothetical protein P8102_10965 [Gammaproteobacteria bacterium]